jgi:hypothetical protein
VRVDDLPVPTMVPHPIPAGAPVDAWPVELRIGIEQAAQTPYVWDDGNVWDDPDPDALVWDAAELPAVWVDAVCDFAALVVDHGAPDDLGLYPAVEMTLSLVNTTGRWSTWTTSGRLTDFPIGTRVAVWTVDPAAGDRWLFAGNTASWLQTADTVTVTAFDAFSSLALDWGAEWTPGTLNDYPLDRLEAIAATAGHAGIVRGDRGDLRLAAPVEDPGTSPLEAMQRAALSDAGIVAGDVDGQVVYADRRWRNGRADQPRVWTFTDNACDAAALVVWDPETGADDAGLVTQVTLTNVDDLVATASAPGPVPLRLTHPTPDLWQTQGDGNELAAWLLTHQSTDGYRVASFVAHLDDPNQSDLWPALLDVRRGDLFGWVTETLGARLDVDVVVAGVRHDIAPGDWQTTVYGTRAVRTRTAILWDQTIYVWDDPNPDATWRP